MSGLQVSLREVTFGFPGIDRGQKVSGVGSGTITVIIGVVGEKRKKKIFGKEDPLSGRTRGTRNTQSDNLDDGITLL